MNQLKIGQFIAQQRKEQNMTQTKLAEKVGVTNKSVSKWECGKSMPDYSVVEVLCRELNITVSELLNGEKNSEANSGAVSNAQAMRIIKRLQALENQKQTLTGILLIVMGIALSAFSQTTGGSSFQDFISGIMLGLSVGSMLIGVYVTIRSLVK